ncbi:MAG: N-acetyltransferase [Chitinophagales bacterium]|nr:N-acetyltransferase [Chitinophagales bacterium]
MSNIHHTKTGNRGSFYYEADGTKLAEMTYTMAGESKMIIDHTEVDDSLKGQGVGKKLLAALVEYVRASNIKVVPLCPFAKATLQKTAEWHDVLAAPM